MSQQINNIKKRMQSVSGALKVTNAMKLVSNVKLKKWKNKMLSNRDYFDSVSLIVSKILSNSKKYISPYLLENNANKKLFIVVSSTLGLCGGYNNNIFRLADSVISQEDDLLVLGGKGNTYYSSFDNKIGQAFSSYKYVEDSKLIKSLTTFITNEFLQGVYKEIHLIYSSYKNSLVFVAKDAQILPIKLENDKDEIDAILEPDEKTLIETVLPFYLENVLYSKLLESEVCEQASRSNAMENATNNGNELMEELKLQFNKARQASITQEITEIVGASKALE